MTCFDYDDLAERLNLVGYPDGHNIFETILKLAVVLDNEELSDYERDLVLNLFSTTGLKQISSLPKDFLSKTKWKPFDYGNVKIGDFVRVSLDSYDSETGKKHNGRVGVLIDMRARRCKVKYIGLSTQEFMTHPMENLESLQKA